MHSVLKNKSILFHETWSAEGSVLSKKWKFTSAAKFTISPNFKKMYSFRYLFIKISMYRTVLLTSSHMIMSDGKVLLVRENQLCALFPEYNSDNSEFYWFLLKCFYQRCSCWRFTLHNRHPYSKRIISPQCQFWWSVYFE